MKMKEYSLTDFGNAEGIHMMRVSSSGGSEKLHSHSYFQIYYVIGGKLLHHTSGKEAILGAGDLFILPPNHPHYVENLDQKPNFYALNFTWDYFFCEKEENKRILEYLAHLQEEKEESVKAKIAFSYEDSLFIRALLERILKEYSDKNEGGREIIKNSVSLLLSLLARGGLEEKVFPHSKETASLMMACMEYVEKHFREEITLSRMAKHLAMSEAYFCTVFRSAAGMPFKEYLNRYRIKKAAKLISEGEKISAAAHLNGFSDLSTFYRNFKKYMNLSPSEFCKKRGI